MSTTTSTEARALKLLGSGVSPEQVANALGVSPGRISQLISNPEFSAQVAEMRFKNLSRANDIDAKYDEMESSLQDRLKDMLCWMTKPGEILCAIRVINAAKRRGASVQAEITQQNTVITLNMPTQIIQHFTKNIHNQVVKAGNQELITVQSSRMKSLLEDSQRNQKENHGNSITT